MTSLASESIISRFQKRPFDYYFEGIAFADDSLKALRYTMRMGHFVASHIFQTTFSPYFRLLDRIVANSRLFYTGIAYLPYDFRDLIRGTWRKRLNIQIPESISLSRKVPLLIKRRQQKENEKSVMQLASLTRIATIVMDIFTSSYHICKEFLPAWLPLATSLSDFSWITYCVCHVVLHGHACIHTSDPSERKNRFVHLIFRISNLALTTLEVFCASYLFQNYPVIEGLWSVLGIGVSYCALFLFYGKHNLWMPNPHNLFSFCKTRRN